MSPLRSAKGGAAAVPLIALLWADGGAFTTLMIVPAALAAVMSACALSLPGVVNRRAALAPAPAGRGFRPRPAPPPAAPPAGPDGS